MGVTAIREVRNNSGSVVKVRNIETPRDTAGGRGDFQPGESRELEIWIPWCWAADQFAHSHINVDVGGQVFAIWQADRGGTDRVRLSTDGAWHDPGDEIGGAATVNGDRTLIVADSGLSLEVRAPVRNPSAMATSGQALISFHRLGTSLSQVFDFEGDAVGVDESALVDRVTNTARDVNRQIKIPLTLSLEDRDGRRAGPTHLDPNETVTGDFSGLLAHGKWSARLEGSAALHPPVIDIDLSWTTVGQGGGGLTAREIFISSIVADPPGSDVQMATGEYVELSNAAQQAIDVGKWFLRDDRGTRIDIPSGYVIKPAGTLRIYTGPGTSTTDRYYAGRQRAIWNNPGDKARLYKSTGEFVYEYVYRR